MKVESLTSSSKIFKALRYFRAGIEAAISQRSRDGTGSREFSQKGMGGFQNFAPVRDMRV